MSAENISLKGGINSGSIDSRGVMRLSSGSHIEVLSATADEPMKVLTINQSGSVTHTHTISLSEDVRFMDISKNLLTGTGIFLNPDNSFIHIVSASSQDISIP